MLPDAIALLAGQLVGDASAAGSPLPGVLPADVALAAVEAALQTGPNEDVLSERQVFLLVPPVVVAFGALFWYAGAAEHVGRARRLLGARAFDPARVDDDGLVAVRGVVRPADGTLEAPGTGEDCVAYELETQALRTEYVHDDDQRRRMKRDDDEDWDAWTWRWSTDEGEAERVPFRVETDDGQVAVDPDDAELDLPTRSVEGSSGLHRWLYTAHPLTGRAHLPKRLLRKLPLASTLTPSRPEREVERALAPGDAVTVLGAVDRPDDAGPEVVAAVAPDDEAQPVEVTPRTRRRLLLGSAWSATTGSLAGLVVFGFAAVMVVVGVSRGVYW